MDAFTMRTPRHSASLRICPRTHIIFALAVSLPISVVGQDSPPPHSRQTQIKISSETTYLLGPLDNEGYVDYVAGANDLYRQGVSQQNNAAIDLWKIVGPSQVPEQFRNRYFEQLGFRPKAKSDEYFIHLGAAPSIVVVNAGQPHPQRDELQIERSRQLEIARKAPWSKQECPEIDNWLELNHRFLNKLLQATLKEKLYEPILNDSNMNPLAAGAARFLPYDELANFLAIHAMNELHQGETSTALESILALHRIAQLSSQLPTILDRTFAKRIASWAATCVEAYLNSSYVDATAARNLLQGLLVIPSLSPSADTLHRWERLCFLDAMQRQAKQYREVIELQHVDWNKAFRIGNQMYDRLANAKVEDDFKAAHAMVNSMTKEAEEFSRKSAIRTGRGFQADKVALIKLSRTPEKLIATAFLSLMFPPFGMVLESDTRALARVHLSVTLAAIRSYERTSAKLPATLRQITADVTEDFTIDPFTGHPLIYRPQGNTALVYSVGPNQQDDDATEFDGSTEAYDFVVRLSALPPLEPEEPVAVMSEEDVVESVTIPRPEPVPSVVPGNTTQSRAKRSMWPIALIGLTVAGGLVACLILVFWRR